MAGVYRVKAADRVTRTLTEVRGTESRSLVLISAWSVATAAGIGLGWYLAQARQNVLWICVPLGICQGLVLLRSLKRALAWAMITDIVCLIAVGVMLALGLPVRAFVIGRGWTTAGDSTIGWAILLLVGIGVPLVSFAQARLIKQWAKAEDALLWIGASTFSFLLIALFGRLVTGLWPSPSWVRGLIEIEPFEPRLWLIGGMWGACTGWALAKIPEVVTSDKQADARQ
jgi:hypothetical protein